MTQLYEFKVLRPMLGDRFYNVGDTRVMTRLDAANLTPHALEEIGPVKAPTAEKADALPVAKKVDPPVENKAERQPRNKAAG